LFPEWEEYQHNYTKLEIGPIEPSAWTTWPTKYKFISIAILVKSDYLVIERKTYDILNLISDLGGLFGILTTFGSFLVQWYSKFNLENFMLSKLHK